MSSDFGKRVVEIIQSIPEGKVMTYKLVAEQAGNPKAARAVAGILKRKSEKYNLPWHRVINSMGKISIKSKTGYSKQKKRLLKEDVIFDKKDRIDFKKYLFLGKMNKKGKND